MYRKSISFIRFVHENIKNYPQKNCRGIEKNPTASTAQNGPKMLEIWPTTLLFTSSVAAANEKQEEFLY
jgi:hypothetical protein